MKKTKMYYPIMKTEAETSQFIGTYYKHIKPTLPETMKQLEQKTGADRQQFADILTAELDKLAGTVNSTLNYARHHADDGQSLIADNEAFINELNIIKTDIKGSMDTISHLEEHIKTRNIFSSLAEGIIPSDYATSSISDTPVDSGLLEDSQES